MIETFAYGLIGGGILLFLVAVTGGIVHHRRVKAAPVPRDQRWDSTEAEVVELFEMLKVAPRCDCCGGRHCWGTARGTREQLAAIEARRREVLPSVTEAFNEIAERETGAAPSGRGPSEAVIHGRVIDGPPWKLALEVGRP